MNKVEIHHIVGEGFGIDNILASGLKSREQLMREGMKLPSMARSFTVDASSIWFWWVPPHYKDFLEKCEWVSIDVDPDATFVLNSQFIPYGDRCGYERSKMRLSDYIKKHERAELLRKELKEGQKIIWDQYTAEPIVVSTYDRRAYDSRFLYLNEISIQRSIIPPSEFKRYRRGNSAPIECAAAPA